MVNQEILQKCKQALSEAFGPRFQGLVLFGSEARGQAGPESDVDLLVLLTGPISLWRDISTCVKAIYPIEPEIDRVFDTIPVNAEDYRNGKWLLFRTAQAEGIAI